MPNVPMPDAEHNFVADLDLTMGLAGYTSVAEITRDALVPAPR